MESFTTSPGLLWPAFFNPGIPHSRTVYPVFDFGEPSLVMESDGPPCYQLPSQAPRWFRSAVEWLADAISPARIFQMNHGGITLGDRYAQVDLLIVLPDSCKDSYSKFDPVLAKVHERYPAISCSLHRLHQLAAAMRNRHLFFSLYCTAAALIYDDGNPSVPLVSRFTPEALSGEVWDRFQPLFNRAGYFQEAALFHRRLHPHSSLSAFFLHQAAEFCLRGVLKSLNGYNKRTHEIKALKQYIRRTAPALWAIFPDSTGEEKRLLVLLDHSYTAARYDAAFEIDPKDIDYWVRQVALLLEKAPGVIDRTLAGCAQGPGNSR